MDYCEAMSNRATSLPFYWKDRREEKTFLLFKPISWNNWLGATLDKQEEKQDEQEEEQNGDDNISIASSNVYNILTELFM